MKKNIPIPIIIIIIITFITIVITFISSLYNEYKEYNKNNCLKKITKLLGVKRKIGTNGHTFVKNKIIEICENIGLTVLVQKFKKDNYDFSNIICYSKNSKNSKNIVLGAHYDGYDSDGVYITDSCTSIALILCLAKTILEKDPNYPLVLAFFDGEERIYNDKNKDKDNKWSKDNSLIGSQRLAESELLDKNSDIYIFDLIGSKSSKIIPFYKKCEKSIEIYKNLYDIDLKYNKQIFSGEISYKNIWDDHLPFIEKGYRVLHLIPDPFPTTHHTLEDNLENVDWDYLEYFYHVMLKHFLSYV